MKKSELKQLIKEEIQKVLNEENQYKHFQVTYKSAESKFKNNKLNTDKEAIQRVLPIMLSSKLDKALMGPNNYSMGGQDIKLADTQVIFPYNMSNQLQKALQEMGAKEAKSNDYYKKGMMYEEDMNNFTLKFIKDFETPLSARDGWGKIIMRDVLNITKAAGEQGLNINDLFKYDKFKDVTVMKPAILNWINQLVQDGYLTKA